MFGPESLVLKMHFLLETPVIQKASVLHRRNRWLTENMDWMNGFIWTAICYVFSVFVWTLCSFVCIWPVICIFECICACLSLCVWPVIWILLHVCWCFCLIMRLCVTSNLYFGVCLSVYVCVWSVIYIALCMPVCVYISLFDQLVSNVLLCISGYLCLYLYVLICAVPAVHIPSQKVEKVLES